MYRLKHKKSDVDLFSELICIYLKWFRSNKIFKSHKTETSRWIAILAPIA